MTTKQLQVYQYIQSGHTPGEARKHFNCSQAYISRSIKIESARHGVVWRDRRLYSPPKDTSK